MKKLLITFLTFIGLFSFANFAKAEINLNDDKIDIDFFYSKTCNHCSDANEFLNKISLKDSDIKIQKFDISQKDSLKLLLEYHDDYKVEEVLRGGVPAIFIENNYFIGFQKDMEEHTTQKYLHYNLFNSIYHVR